jgi:hypothetical protein
MPGAEIKRTYRSRTDSNVNKPFEFAIDDVEFVAYPGRIPSAALIDVGGMAVSQDSRSMWELFECAFPDKAEFQRFRETLLSPDHPLDAEVMGDLIKDFAEAAADRPTEPSAP